MRCRRLGTALGAATLVALVSATAAAEPELYFLEQQAGAISVACEAAVCARELRIVSRSTKPLAFRLSASKLLKDGGSAADVTLVPAQRVVEPMAVVDVTMSVKLDGPGSYVGLLTLVTEDKRWIEDARLVVAWSPAPPPAVEMLGVTSVGAEPGSTAWIRFDVRELAGREAVLPPPTLASLRRAASQLSVDGKITKILDDSGTEQPTIDVAPFATRSYSAELTGLPEADDYAATLRLSPPGAKAVEGTARIMVRRSKWLAGVCIALGALLGFVAYFVRVWLRPALTRQRRVEFVLDGLQRLDVPELAPDERHVLEELRRQVVAMSGAAEVNELDTARLQAYEAKGVLFAYWRREKERLKLLAPRLSDEELRTASGDVEAARSALLLTSARLEQVDEKIASLDGLPARLLGASKEYLVSLEQALLHEIEQDKLSLGLDELYVRLNGDLERLGSIGAWRDLELQYEEYEKVAREYLNAAMNELTSTLEREPPYPVTMPDQRKLAEQVRKLLAGAAGDSLPVAVARYRSALGRYVAGFADACVAAAHQIKTRASGFTANAAHKEQAEKLVVDGAQIEGELMAKRRELKESNLRSIWQELLDLCGKLADVARGVELLSDGPRTEATVGRSTDVATKGPLGVPPAEALSRVEIPAPRAMPGRVTLRDQMRALDWRVVLVDSALLAGALVVAVVWGVSVLWGPNLTWGSSADLITAVLWGLGVQAAAGGSFQGVAQLRGLLGGR